jgi:uncharacterized protein (DUF58 family)
MNNRTKLREVMQRASLLDISELLDTELMRGSGRRESPATSYSGLGRMVSVITYTPEHDISAVNWNLSAQTFPRKKLIIKRQRLIKKDWAVVVDCSRTMNFGSETDLKVITGLQIAASFAQIGLKKRDRVAQLIVGDERTLTLEDASVEEMVLMALSQTATSDAHSRSRAPVNKRSKGGFAYAATQLPENSSIVPVISDFMNFTDADKQALVRASRFHRVLCCVIEDPREKRFPDASGQITLQDITTGRRSTMSFAQADKLVSADREARLADLIAFFKSARIPYACFETGESLPATRTKLTRLMQHGA